MSLVFIYGTLKQGHINSHYLESAVFKGITQTKNSVYKMLAVTSYNYPYPVMMEGGTGAIEGELYEMHDDLIQFLDDFEGIEYERRLITLRDGQDAYGYIGREFRGYIETHKQILYDLDCKLYNWQKGD